MVRAKELMEQLELLPHPEGGFYKLVYKAADTVLAPDRFETNDRIRSATTAIYYLLESGDFSAFHRIKSDEIWSFVEGAPVLIHILHSETQRYSMMKLGELKAGASPIIIVPFGAWFAAEVDGDDTYSLVNCFVSPGFEYSDFELAKREELSGIFSEYKEIIARLTHPSVI